MKNVSICLLIIVLCVSCFTACGRQNQIENAFFSEEMLAEYHLTGMPVPPGVDNCVLYAEGVLYLNISLDEYRVWVGELVSYLRAKEDIYYLGYQIGSGLDGEIFPFREITAIPDDYKLTAYRHEFIFAREDGLGDRGNLYLQSPIRIDIERGEGELRNGYAYNTVISLYDNYRASAQYIACPDGHTYEYYQDGIGHGWNYTCGCDTPPNFAPHFDGDGDGGCDGCGYRVPPHEHTGEWVIGETSHAWYFTCGCESADIAEEHLDTDGDNACDMCGYVMPNPPATEEGYTLTIRDAEWLYEPIPTKAKAGEVVSVKIRMVLDMGYLFLVNGEEVAPPMDVDGLYWAFTFAMPAQDTVIDFKTYDGFLPDPNYSILIETYWKLHLDAPTVGIRKYYGEFGDGVLVAMIDAGNYDAAIWEEVIGEIRIPYRDGNRILVLFDGAFYNLTEAYEQGLITESELNAIYTLHIGE